jgi:hypothetical protein
MKMIEAIRKERKRLVREEIDAAIERPEMQRLGVEHTFCGGILPLGQGLLPIADCRLTIDD